VKSAATPEKKIERLYEIAFQRAPESDELKLAKHFIDAQSKIIPEPQVPAWSYGYGELDTNTMRLAEFKTLPKFVEETWRGGDKLPDEKLGWVMLTENGGHPGEKFAAVRRWTAPRDLEISITGRLGHESGEGDGVRGRVLLNNEKELGVWTVKKSKEKTNLDKIAVKKGDTVDFVVDKRGDTNSDSFTWTPTIQADGAQSTGLASEWNAKDDYSGPKELNKPLDAWEKFAQVILMSNELVFVD
jgi:hypothetical protein